MLAHGILAQSQYPVVATAAAFDPTLGGTLTLISHLDFTDGSTMTLSLSLIHI